MMWNYHGKRYEASTESFGVYRLISDLKKHVIFLKTKLKLCTLKIRLYEK